MRLIKLAAGDFVMGSPDGQGRSDERPERTVNLSAFAIGETEVTQAQWRTVMDTDPSRFIGDDRPVEQVTWEDAVAFCQELSTLSGLTIQLPTEAEWEYACRSGTSTAYSFGDDEALLGDYAWYRENSNETQDVAGKLPNSWGLYDVHGNVWEWCNDWYGATHYGDRPNPDSDPQGPSLGPGLVMRGGDWNNDAPLFRSATRNWRELGYNNFHIGFRIAAETP
jgi:formylglycine-generating enzyme required for sulfatase activity